MKFSAQTLIILCSTCILLGCGRIASPQETPEVEPIITEAIFLQGTYDLDTENITRAEIKIEDQFIDLAEIKDAQIVYESNSFQNGNISFTFFSAGGQGISYIPGESFVFNFSFIEAIGNDAYKLTGELVRGFERIDSYEVTLTLTESDDTLVVSGLLPFKQILNTDLEISLDFEMILNKNQSLKNDLIN